MLLHPYNPSWPEIFNTEKEALNQALGDLPLRIDHVGSTSVPGLLAKPIIDIQISVAKIDVPVFEGALKTLGYHHLPMPEPSPDVYPFFRKPKNWPTTHHVHFCIINGEEEVKHLAFRDWLRTHPEDMAAYAALKEGLAKEVDDADVETIYRYTARKGPWIQKITRKAMAESS